MMQDRVRVTLKVDPATKVVTRDGVPVDLGPETVVDAGEGQARTLRTIVDGYAQASGFADVESGFPPDVQEAIGVVLYRALGADNFVRRRDRWLEITIDDGSRDGASISAARVFLERLPWTLTAVPDEGSYGFLVQAEDHPWVITLDGGPRAAKVDQLFPPEPKLLLMIPSTFPDTESAEHEAEILRQLTTCYGAAAFVANCRTARTWSQASAILAPGAGFDPDVIYFYGHGRAARDGSVFVFDPEPGQISEVSARTIRKLLASRPKRTAVFFGNCCQGTSAGRASLGEELPAQVSCLIANRTVADPAASRAFGLEVLRQIVVEAAAPHVFMAAATSLVIETLGGSEVGGRWACPVVYTNYARWIALDPARRRDLRRATAGSFVERIDRLEPVKQAVEQLKPFFESTGVALRAFAWQADAAQGVEAFGRRLRDEIYERFTTRTVREHVVELQADAIASGNAAKRANLFAALFVALAKPDRRHDLPETASLMEEVLTLLEKHLTTAGVVLLIRLGPVTIDGTASQLLIRAYWRVWIDLRRELAKRNRNDLALRIVVAVALDLAPDKQVGIANLLLPPDDDPTATVVDLGLLGSVKVEDLVEHFTTFATAYVSVAGNEREERAEAIYVQTEGVFVPTQIVLKAEAGLT